MFLLETKRILSGIICNPTGATHLGCQQGNPFPIQQLREHTYVLYLAERLDFQKQDAALLNGRSAHEH